MLHNDTQELTEHADIENSERFLDLEISVDESFDGDVADIKDGKFVSFRYIADRGIPKNPRVSILTTKKDENIEEYNINNDVTSEIYTIRDDVTNWTQTLHSKRRPPGMTPHHKHQHSPTII